MTPSHCELALSAADILAALDEGIPTLDRLGATGHVAHCESCRGAVRLRARARAAWTAAARHDDVIDRAASEERLLRARHASRHRTKRPLRPLVLAGVTTVACAATLGALMKTWRSTPPVNATRPAVKTEAPATATTTLPILGGQETISTVPRGARVQRMVVPSGSRVTLGFAIGGEAVADRDAVLVGPATARVSDTSLILERGAVRLRGVHYVNVAAPGATAEINGATCTLRVDDQGVARIEVDRGTVLVTPAGPSAPIAVDAGGALEVDAAGIPRTHAKGARDPKTLAFGSRRPPRFTGTPFAANPDQPLAEARSKLHEGDAAGARADVEKLATSEDPRVARRASFMLAEIDLTSGARERARARLELLIACPEPTIAADAAALLARSQTTPADRAAAWRRYLATAPASPYYERALLERAEALLDAALIPEAQALIGELRQSTNLTEAQRAKLERLASRTH